ncbi:hypothetical protein KEJ27_09765 [Candidatus Bathyarchaeota archaeon]|nr:hypothetical protein [Candidatus Bathyarchaeota archaeon]
MKIAWLSGNHNISLNEPYSWLCLGVRGSGKSAFLEHLAELHLSEGNAVLDLFAARSGENLGWLRSRWTKEKKILLLTAENAVVELSRSLENVDMKPAGKISLQDFNDYDIIINSSPLYPTLDAEFEAVNQIIEKLWKRLKWSRLVFVLVREAASLLYSRLKVAENQTLAKAFLTYWLRESRHVGCSLGLDSQRFMAVDIDIRALCDFLVFKAQGAGGLPKDLHYVYRHIDPAWLQYAKPYQFAILSRRGDIGVGVFPLAVWHVKEGEGIVDRLNLKIQFEEQPLRGEDRGTYQTVGDREHAEIIHLYAEGLSMKVLAARFSRSSGTIKSHIDRHNVSVLKVGYCPACRRASSPLEATPAKHLV